MKKTLWIVGGSLLALVAVVYVGVVFFLGGIVKAGVNNFGPKLTQTRVELAGATLSPLTGTGTLTGLAVGNPSGWSDGNAFFLGKVHLDVVPGSVFKDTVIINELTIDRPEFSYETSLFSSNIKELLKNIESVTGAGGGGGREPAAKSGQPRKFIVKKFRLTNAKATVGVGPTALPVELAAISFDNLGVAEGGLTASQLSTVVMRDVLNKLVAAAATGLAQDGGKATLQKAKEAAKQLEDNVKALFKKKP